MPSFLVSFSLLPLLFVLLSFDKLEGIMLALCWFALTLSALSLASPVPNALSPLFLAKRDSNNELVARAPGYCPLVDEIVNRARAFVDVTPFCSSLLRIPTATATSVAVAAATSLTTKTVPTTVVS